MTYGPYNASGTPKRALARVLVRLWVTENDIVVAGPYPGEEDEPTDAVLDTLIESLLPADDPD